MVRRTRFALPVIILVVSFGLQSPLVCAPEMQDSVVYKSAVEQSFQEAMNLFRAGRYEEAQLLFERIVEMPVINHRTSASSLMAAKALYHRGDYPASVALLQSFLKRFERSEYIDDALYTLALNYYQLEEYKESARLFLKVRLVSSDAPMAARSVRMLGIVAADHLEIASLHELLAEARQTETVALLTVRLAEKLLQTGDAKGTKELLGTILDLPTTIPAVAEAHVLLERVDRSGVVRIGIVLPLTSKSDPSTGRGLGQELLNGIRLATDEYNAESMPKVNLEVRDSERDAGVAARQVSELSSDEQIVAILGPVFSNEAFAGAEIASRRATPLVTPTATASGIAAVGRSIFQVNPDLDVRGKALAQYAYLVKGARRFAVLAASDSAEITTAAAFIRELRELGGELVDIQYYKPGQTDLRDELTIMRQRCLEVAEPVIITFGGKLRPAELKKIVAWGVPQQVLDSLTTANAQATVESLFGDQGRRIADSLKIPVQRIRAKYDSLGLPVTSIDALFLPIASSDEIGIVSSQLRYFNFQTQLLGTGNWNEANELEQNRQYTNGVMFTSDSYWDDAGKQFQQFAKRFRAKFLNDPSLNSIIGYDAMKFLLRAVRGGRARREDITLALSSSELFQGVHSKISLDERRVNSCLTILQFKNRSIKKIGEIDVSRKTMLDADQPQ